MTGCYNSPLRSIESITKIKNRFLLSLKHSISSINSVVVEEHMKTQSCLIANWTIGPGRGPLHHLIFIS